VSPPHGELMSSNGQGDLLIRGMTPGDLVFAARCTLEEGWLSEDLTTLEGFFLNDPHGCFIAFDHEHPVGICIATRYAKRGFIGELIVRPQARGRGLGAMLLNHAVARLKAGGVETVFLDGVLNAVPLYERNGFVKICRSWRFSGYLPGKPCRDVRRMEIRDLPQVFALDSQAFGADRSFFLQRRLEIFPELSYVMVNNDRVSGFILGRGHENWLSAGPWVMDDGSANPADMLFVFAQQAGDRPISIGILDSNPRTCDLVLSLGFTQRPDSPWRMAYGNLDNLGASPQCYAVGSAAKG
jgi:ribosomal protein S18 acetylase RimI-like enzyme